MRKTCFLPYANNKGADQPEYNISSFCIRNLKSLSSFCGCAGRFESYLVGNPEDRFSRDVALIKTGCKVIYSPFEICGILKTFCC